MGDGSSRPRYKGNDRRQHPVQAVRHPRSYYVPCPVGHGRQQYALRRGREEEQPGEVLRVYYDEGDYGSRVSYPDPRLPGKVQEQEQFQCQCGLAAD